MADKPLKRPEFEVQEDATEVFLTLQPEYLRSLVGPSDDMWTAFAEQADHYALLVNGQTVGFCAINDDREIMSFYVQPPFEDVAEALFSYLIKRFDLVAANASTVDPGFLSLSLDAGHQSVAVALMFQHLLDPDGEALTGLRLASTTDLAAAITFAEEAIGASRTFLESYFAERIEKRELHVHEKQGTILATGECRQDLGQMGYAHLGLIVGREQRGKGLGTSLMHALVLESCRQNLQPLCSTEPQNMAARSIIHKVGFRARHRVYRVTLAS